MKIADFERAAIALIGTAVGWQTKIARRLGVADRTVRRWIADGETPAWADEKLAELTGMTDRLPWPRDEWIVGDGVGEDGSSREYVIHTARPRFVARVVALDEATEEPEAGEHPCDTVSGTVRQSGDYLLCEVEWIDDPLPGEIVQLMEAASDAIDLQGERLMSG